MELAPLHLPFLGKFVVRLKFATLIRLPGSESDPRWSCEINRVASMKVLADSQSTACSGVAMASGVP